MNKPTYKDYDTNPYDPVYNPSGVRARDVMATMRCSQHNEFYRGYALWRKNEVIKKNYGNHKHNSK